MFAFDQFSRLGRQRWLAIALVAVVALLFLPHGRGMEDSLARTR